MYSIHDEPKVKDFFKQNKIPSFRYDQIENAIYKNFVTEFDNIQTIPKELRELLKQNFYFTSLEVDTIGTSSNGQTTKILFKTQSDDFIEAVIMRHLTGRNTLCVSSQV